MHHISWSLATLGKICLGLCTTISGALTIFTLGTSLFLFVRAYAQSPYDYRQDDHMQAIDKRQNESDAERKERRTETLKVRADDEAEILALEKIVAAQAGPVSKIDDIHDRQIRDEAYVGGALGIIGVFQFYLNNKEKSFRKLNDKRYTRKPFNDLNEDDDN